MLFEDCGKAPLSNHPYGYRTTSTATKPPTVTKPSRPPPKDPYGNQVIKTAITSHPDHYQEPSLSLPSYPDRAKDLYRYQGPLPLPSHLHCYQAISTATMPSRPLKSNLHRYQASSTAKKQSSPQPIDPYRYQGSSIAASHLDRYHSGRFSPNRLPSGSNSSRTELFERAKPPNLLTMLRASGRPSLRLARADRAPSSHTCPLPSSSSIPSDSLPSNSSVQCIHEPQKSEKENISMLHNYTDTQTYRHIHIFIEIYVGGCGNISIERYTDIHTWLRIYIMYIN